MNDIEKLFYDTFQIEIKEKGYCGKGYCNRKPVAIKFDFCQTCRKCENGHFYILPEFTDHRLLKLICVMTNIYGVFPSINKGEELTFSDLKNEILRLVINAYKILDANWKPKMFEEVRKIMEVA
jgi:hypothetical protein